MSILLLSSFFKDVKYVCVTISEKTTFPKKFDITLLYYITLLYSISLLTSFKKVRYFPGLTPLFSWIFRKWSHTGKSLTHS